jgi:hypothetical protein
MFKLCKRHNSRQKGHTSKDVGLVYDSPVMIGELFKFTLVRHH